MIESTKPLLEGKLYLVLSRIAIIPERRFYLSKEEAFHETNYWDTQYVDRTSEPNIFMFVKYVNRNAHYINDTRYCLILYKSKLFVTSNEYHIGNSIKIL